MDNTQTINILSLCTGYGGLELGLARALEGVFRVVAVEIEAYALANLACKAQEGKLAIEAMWPDLKTFPAERFRGCFDFILAGYPCQPFSTAGKRQGADDPRHLFPHIARIVEAVRPVWCFFENVPGHLSIGFPEVYRSLRDMGYKVEAGLFTAAEVGAPHKRQRLFILAQSERSNDRRASRQIQSEDEQQAEKRQEGRVAELSRSGQLADTEYRGPQIRRAKGNGKAQGRNIQDDRTAITELCPTPPANRWPSRPGQPQYEWEEPRVVGNAPRKRLPKRSRGQMGGYGESQPKSKRPSSTTKNGQAQSGVGRAVDGTRNRVDGLRLLGNGVVPQQAEKAFRELVRLFE